MPYLLYSSCQPVQQFRLHHKIQNLVPQTRIDLPHAPSPRPSPRLSPSPSPSPSTSTSPSPKLATPPPFLSTLQITLKPSTLFISPPRFSKLDPPSASQHKEPPPVLCTILLETPGGWCQGAFRRERTAQESDPGCTGGSCPSHTPSPGVMIKYHSTLQRAAQAGCQVSGVRSTRPPAGPYDDDDEVALLVYPPGVTDSVLLSCLLSGREDYGAGMHLLPRFCKHFLLFRYCFRL